MIVAHLSSRAELMFEEFKAEGGFAIIDFIGADSETSFRLNSPRFVRLCCQGAYVSARLYTAGGIFFLLDEYCSFHVSSKNDKTLRKW